MMASAQNYLNKPEIPAEPAPNDGVLVGCAGVAIRCVTQLLVVIWSLRADEKGRRHAIEILKALRWDGFKQRLPRRGGPNQPRPRGAGSAGSYRWRNRPLLPRDTAKSGSRLSESVSSHSCRRELASAGMAAFLWVIAASSFPT